MPPEDPHRVACTLDVMLERRGMTVTQLAEQVGVTLANLSILKNNRAKAIRFSTLTAICDALQCQPAELLRVQPGRRERGKQNTSAYAGRTT